MSSQHSTLRPLGAHEEFFWTLDQIGTVHFVCIAEVRGRTTIDGWRQALDELQQRHPLLSVAIEPAGDGAPCFRHVPDRPIPLRIAPVGTTWQQEAERELATPFAALQATLARAVLLHDAESATILLSLHHAIADGTSGALAIRDLLRALSGHSLEALGPVGSRDQLLGYPPRPATSGSRAAFDPARVVRPERSAPTIQARALAEPVVRQLRRCARQQETTLHGILGAAIALAGRTITPRWEAYPIRLNSPINCRTLVGLHEQCVPMITAGTYAIEPDTRKGVWDIARDIRNALVPFTTLDGIQGQLRALNDVVATGMSPMDAGALLNSRLPAELMITNIGELPFAPDFGPLTMTAFWGPCVARGVENEQIIGAATLAGELRLVQTSREPLAGLLEQVESQLIRAIDLVSAPLT